MSSSAASDVSAAQQQSLQFAIGIAVAKKGLDAAKSQGEAAASLLNAAVELSKAAGKGGEFDAVG